MLLSTYGIRARELIALRLEDIDWRNEVLRIRHSKTNTHSELPLLRTAAAAILEYLKKGRPQTERRELFLRALAPYRPLSGAAALHHCIERHLGKCATSRPGKRGAHALRHARAATLLSASVPLKTIGDVLGHASPNSTMIYLKWATQELRAVGLDLPAGVSS
jgi:integrase